MNTLDRRLAKLEAKTETLPMAIVQLSNGEQKRLDICAIARLYFDNPQQVTSLQWISGDCSGVICQLLEWDDFWMEVKKYNDKN